MNNALAQLTLFWKQRNARERAILAAGGSVLLLVLIYSAIIAPLLSEHSRLQRTLPTLRADAARFERDLAQATGGPAGPTVAADIAALAAAAGLSGDNVKISRADNQRSSLSAKAVAWSAVTALLASSQAQGWSLSKLSVRSVEGGNVDADVEWTR